MESFAVICETCHARLKVRSESLVGEIHPCPKCGSMVQILPPDFASRSQSRAAAARDELPAPPLTEGVSPTLEFIESPPVPAAAAATTSALVFWSVAGVAIALSGLAATIWVIGGRSSSPESPQATATTAKTIERDPYAVQSSPVTADVPAKESAPIIAKVQSEPVADPRQEPIEQSLVDNPIVPELPALPEQPVETPQAEKAASHQPMGAGVAKVHPTPSVLRLDPLDFDPSRLNLSDIAPANVTDSIADDAVDEADTENSLADSETDVTVPAPAREKTIYARVGPIPSEAGRHDDEGRLDFRIESLELSEVPLHELVAILSEMADLAITLDPVALQAAGVSPRAVVSVQGTDVTLGELLRGALARHHLLLVERGGQLAIGRDDDEQWRSVKYEVNDLVRGGNAKEMAELIERFVAPTTWEASGGKGTIAVDDSALHVEQSQMVHSEILLFCERLRLACGIATRSRYPTEQLSIEPSWNAIQSKLNEPATFTFLPGTRFAEIVRFWEDATGATILMDWSALTQCGFLPSTPVACSVIDRSWDDTFDGILNRLKLAWWPVDGDTIQITSCDALDKIERVEFYPVRASQNGQRDADALIAVLQAAGRNSADGPQSESKSVYWKLDESSGRLIVRATPTMHRNLSRHLRNMAE